MQQFNSRSVCCSHRDLWQKLACSQISNCCLTPISYILSPFNNGLLLIGGKFVSIQLSQEVVERVLESEKNLFRILILLIYHLRIQKTFFSIKVTYTSWLLGAKMSVLRNEPLDTENIFRETCLCSVCLVAFKDFLRYGCILVHQIQCINSTS